jgi:hypothetical protein
MSAARLAAVPGRDWFAWTLSLRRETAVSAVRLSRGFYYTDAAPTINSSGLPHDLPHDLPQPPVVDT